MCKYSVETAAVVSKPWFVKCPAQPILLDLITIMFDEEYKL
jgi:hypothetical protein